MSHLLPHKKSFLFSCKNFPCFPLLPLLYVLSHPFFFSLISIHRHFLLRQIIIYPHFILLVLFSRPKSSSSRLTELHFFLSASPWSVAITSCFPLINQRSSRDFSVEAWRNNSPLCDCLRPLDQSPLHLFRALLGWTDIITSPFLSSTGSRFQNGHLSSPFSGIDQLLLR